MLSNVQGASRTSIITVKLVGRSGAADNSTAPRDYATRLIS